MGITKGMRINTLTIAVLGTLAVMAQPTSVLAEDAPASAKLDSVTVTGSNIRRTDTETPSPVQILTADDLKKSGYTSVSEILRNITANGQGTLSQGFSGAFASGASGIALRGLTVGATLVLIDGHRTAPYPLSDDGQRSFVDITQIPFDAVERIEILKDGASSVYGSDAIAGVVNVILKKSFTGTSVTAELGGTTHGGGQNQHLAITHGVNGLFADGDTGFVSAEYRHQQPIQVIQRSSLFRQRDYTPYGGVNITPGVGNINSSYPFTSSGYTVSPSGVFTGFLPGSPCTATTVVAGAVTPNCPQPGNLSVLQLQPDTHNVNVIGKLSHDLGNAWTATLQASVFSSWAEQVNGYQSTGAFGLGTVTAGPGIVSSPYPAAGPVYATVPSTGDTLVANLTSLGPQHTVTDTQSYRLIADVSGAYAGWDLTFSGGFTKGLTHANSTGYLNLQNYQTLLASLPATTTPAQLYAALQNPANTSALGPHLTATSSSELDFVNAGASRPIYTLAGGDLAVSVGLDYTHHALATVPAAGVAQGLINGANNAYAIGEQDVAAAYFELAAPVLKSLEIDVSGRVDDVNTYGTSRTPKLGFKYTPIQELTLRGTYSRGFRAPNPAEAGSAGQSFYFAQIQDPLLCKNGANDPASYSAQCAIVPPFLQTSNPQLLPETSRSYTLGVVFEPLQNQSITLDYYHIELDNQITSAINIPGELTALVNNAVRLSTPTNQPLVGGGTSTPTVGNIAYIPTPYLNANTVVTKGLDIDVRNVFSLGEYGKLTSDINASHIFNYTLTTGGFTVELAGTHGPSGISGDTGTPQTRIQWTLNWDKGPLSLAGTVNYIGHYDVTDPSNQQLNTCVGAIDGNFNGSFNGVNTPVQGVCTVGSFTTLDLYGSYQLTKQFNLHGSILNAFDRQPPLDLQTYGGSNYNPSLHQAGAVGRALSIGGTYTF